MMNSLIFIKRNTIFEENMWEADMYVGLFDRPIFKNIARAVCARRQIYKLDDCDRKQRDSPRV